jgi:hypothetical protein
MVSNALASIACDLEQSHKINVLVMYAFLAFLSGKMEFRLQQA